MKPSEYVANALRTESKDFEKITNNFVKSPDSTKLLRLLHASMGMNTEASEITDALKKHIFYGKPLDTVNIAEELGDLLWYIAIASDALGTSIEAIMETNIAKLKARYGDKFTEEAATTRDLKTEREILEKVNSADTLWKQACVLRDNGLLPDANKSLAIFREDVGLKKGDVIECHKCDKPIFIMSKDVSQQELMSSDNFTWYDGTSVEKYAHKVCPHCNNVFYSISTSMRKTICNQW